MTDDIVEFWRLPDCLNQLSDGVGTPSREVMLDDPSMTFGSGAKSTLFLTFMIALMSITKCGCSYGRHHLYVGLSPARLMVDLGACRRSTAI